MAQPFDRSQTAVRAYTVQLRRLWAQLDADPLDELKTIEFVCHMVNNRGVAAGQLHALHTQARGA